MLCHLGSCLSSSPLHLLPGHSGLLLLPEPPMKAKVTLLVTRVVWGLWHPYQNARKTLWLQQTRPKYSPAFKIWYPHHYEKQNKYQKTEWSECLSCAPLHSSHDSGRSNWCPRSFRTLRRSRWGQGKCIISPQLGPGGQCSWWQYFISS